MTAISTFGAHASASVKLDNAKRDWLFMFTYFATSLLAIAMLFTNVLEYKAGLVGKASMVIPALLLACLLCEFAFLARRFSNDVQKVFLLISVPAVLAFGLFIIPGTVPDEHAHIAQALDLFGRHSGTFLVLFGVCGWPVRDSGDGYLGFARIERERDGCSCHRALGQWRVVLRRRVLHHPPVSVRKDRADGVSS